MNLTLSVSPEQVDLLLDIFNRMPQPRGDIELSDLEKCEIAFDALLSSYESTLDAEAGAVDSSPVDAAELRRALEEVTNPSIATEYVPPKPVDRPAAGAPKYTFEQIVDAASDNAYVREVLGAEALSGERDQLSRDAICLVFSQIPPAQWSSESLGVLLVSARSVLQKSGA